MYYRNPRTKAYMVGVMIRVGVIMGTNQLKPEVMEVRLNRLNQGRLVLLYMAALETIINEKLSADLLREGDD